MKQHRTLWTAVLVAAVSWMASAVLPAQQGTEFSYQGQILQNGTAVNGTCDLQFLLFDASTAGFQVGSTQTKTNVVVTGGRFTVLLDFGPRFHSAARWLEIQARCPAGSGGYTTLGNRQQLTPAPYALALPGLHTENNATSPNVIGGHEGNTVTPGVVGAVIAGGGRGWPFNNRVTDDYGTVGGGSDNQAGDDAGATNFNTDATVGGGFGNTASGSDSTVGGGDRNTASGRGSTVGGGGLNTADGFFATVAGGHSNTASALFSTAAGGELNTAGGDYSFAAGRRAKAPCHGCFVWADSKDFDFGPGGFIGWPDQFWVRSTGGARFITAIDGSGAGTSGVYLFPGDGSWSSLSDQDLKEHFQTIDPGQILERVARLSIQTWSYKAQGDKVRHMGPVAQDFYRAFGLGTSERHIGGIDADGVALAAIQGLYRQLQDVSAELRARNAQMRILEAEMNDREAQIAVLEKRLGALETALLQATSRVPAPLGTGKRR